MLKIALINIHSPRYREHQTIGATNITYLASYLRHYLDIELDIRIDVVTDRLLGKFKPDIIGLSSTTENYNLALRDIRSIQREWPEVPILIGGPHISALPQSLPDIPNLIGVIGEGEETFLELIQSFLTNQEFDQDALLEIQGLVFYDKTGQLAYTPPRVLAEDIDTIPIPERELLLQIPEHHQPALLTSRGCPFRCTFCSTRMLWKEIRFHSPERVVEELFDILRIFPDQPSLRIDDDLFTLNIKRLRVLAGLIREEGLHKKIRFTVSARANTLSKEVCLILKDMNVQSIFFGLETGSQNVLRQIKGPVIQVDHNQRAIDLCDKYGFWITGSFIIGSPEETHQDIYQTYWFIRKNYHKFGQINVAYSVPFPDTPLFAQAEKAGLIDENFKDWQVLNFNFEPDKSVFLNQHYTKDEFVAMNEEFWKVNVEKFKEVTLQAPQRAIYVKYRQETYLKLMKSIKVNAVKRVLEIGAIHSDLDQLLPSDSYEVVSMVPDKGIVGEIEGTFDLIFIHHSLECMTEPLSFLKSLRSHLNPNGQLVCIVFNANHLTHLMELLVGRWQPVDFGIYQWKHLKMFTFKSLQTMALEAGYVLNNFKAQSKAIDLNKMPVSIRQAVQLLQSHLSLSKTLDFDTFSYLLELEPQVIPEVLAS